MIMHSEENQFLWAPVASPDPDFWVWAHYVSGAPQLLLDKIFSLTRWRAH